MNKLAELRLHVSVLSAAVERDPTFFAPMIDYLRRLDAKLARPASDLSQRELLLLTRKIEDFYLKLGSTAVSGLLQDEPRMMGFRPSCPRQITDTEYTLRDISVLVWEISNLSETDFVAQVAELWAASGTSATKPLGEPIAPCVFVGHGRSKLWARVKVYLQDELGLRTVTYESESRTGESIVPILEKMLDQSSFAVLVLTAEDETASGSRRSRQNVVHEAGLFQGRLGFNRAILLIQEGLEEFSNVAGLQYIPFLGDRIEHTFYELRRVLEREGQIP